MKPKIEPQKAASRQSRQKKHIERVVATFPIRFLPKASGVIAESQFKNRVRK